MAKATSSSSALDKAVAALNKAYKTKNDKDWGNVDLDYENLKEPLPHLPTGSLVVDYLIGGSPNRFGVSPCPGVPRGRIMQIWGHESAGKTTLCLTVAATTCQKGGTVCYIDFENDIVPDYAAALGVPIDDPSRFRLVQPETLEDGFRVMHMMAQAGVDLIIVDSVGAAIPKESLSKDFDESEQPGVLARQWGRFLPRIKTIITKSNTALIGISQVRSSFGGFGGFGGGSSKSIQGGNAWKFYAAVRLELARIKNEKQKLHNALNHKMEERVYGGIIKAKMVKCKLSSSQGREENFYIRWGEGIDDVRSLLDIAQGHNLITRSGSWYTWVMPDGNEVKAQGIESLRGEIVGKEEYLDNLYEQTLPFLTKDSDTKVDENTDEYSVDEIEDFDLDAAEAEG